jgi:hypothetical protein
MSGRTSLAGAFAPVTPSRGATLQGLLAPKRGRGTHTSEEAAPEAPAEEPTRTPIQPQPAIASESAGQTRDIEETSSEEDGEVAPAGGLAPATKPTRRRPTPQKAAPGQNASELVPGALRNVGVYLPPELLAEVKDAVYRARTTYADLLIDAFEAVENQKIATEFTSETTPTTSGMPRRAPRRRGEAGIQIQLRLDGMQVAWLDEKVTVFDAPSRSALVSTVFKLHMRGGNSSDGV